MMQFIAQTIVWFMFSTHVLLAVFSLLPHFFGYRHPTERSRPRFLLSFYHLYLLYD